MNQKNASVVVATYNGGEVLKKTIDSLLKQKFVGKFEVIVVSVAAKGLGKEWLGRTIDKKALKELIKLDKEIGLNVAGEGGEYESFVLDAPFFEKKLKVIEAIKHWDKTTGFYEIKEMKLEEK